MMITRKLERFLSLLCRSQMVRLGVVTSRLVYLGGCDKLRLHFVRLLKQIQGRKACAIIIKITWFIALLSWKAKSCYFCWPARQCYCRAACWACYESHCIPKRIIYLLVTYCRSLCCVRRIKSERRREKKTIKESIMMNYFCALNKSTENEKSRVGETLATQRNRRGVNYQVVCKTASCVCLYH